MMNAPDANDARFDALCLDNWRARLADLPELRWTKVMRVRRAIATQRYDSDHALDRAIDNLHDEIGVLFRDRWTDLPDD